MNRKVDEARLTAERSGDDRSRSLIGIVASGIASEHWRPCFVRLLVRSQFPQLKIAMAQRAC